MLFLLFRFPLFGKSSQKRIIRWLLFRQRRRNLFCPLHRHRGRIFLLVVIAALTCCGIC